MIHYNGCHPWEQWFCRFFDKNWTPSHSPYFYKLQFDKDGNPKHLQRFYKEKDGGTSYCGTYEILYYTERMGDQYIIMRRIANQTFEHIEYVGDERAPDEIGDSFVARFYPTGWERIEMMPPSQIAGEAVIEEYRNNLKSEANISTDF